MKLLLKMAPIGALVAGLTLVASPMLTTMSANAQVRIGINLWVPGYYVPYYYRGYPARPYGYGPYPYGPYYAPYSYGPYYRYYGSPYGVPYYEQYHYHHR